jgi:hypothetical protein
MLPPSGPQPFIVGTLPGCVRLVVLGGQVPSWFSIRQPGLTAVVANAGSGWAKARPKKAKMPAVVALETSCQAERPGAGAATVRVKESKKVVVMGIRS